MSADLFEGPKLKIKRAYRHIQDLDAIVAAFIGSDAHKIVINKDFAGRTQIRMESSQKTPVEISLTFGDAIHNLRAALDHTMGKLVEHLAPGVNPDHIYFPIRDDRHGLKAALENAEVGKAMATALGKNVASVILDQIKPYGGWDNPFRALNKLDNIDKHRLLLTLLSLGGVRFDAVMGTGNVFRNCFSGTQLGSNCVLIESDMEINGNFYPVLDVRIDERELPPNQSLIPTIKNIAKFTSEAVEAIERCIP